MRRVKFKKGEQRKFLKEVLFKLYRPSLRGLLEFGLDINYSTLKNYFTEQRLMPEDLFNDLCYLAKIDKNSLEIEFLEKNWGQVKGGRMLKA